MKIKYINRLVDITGFHQLLAEGLMLTITYPIHPSGVQQDSDVFEFSYPETAQRVVDQVVSHGHTDLTLSVMESDGVCRTWLQPRCGCERR